MDEVLKAKIVKRLGDLNDEQGRQLLDYVEFLGSKYNRSRRSPSPFQRVAETIDETIGRSGIADMAAKGTSSMVEAAGKIVSGLAAAGKAMADELTGSVGSPTPAGDGAGGGGTADNGTASEGGKPPTQSGGDAHAGPEDEPKPAA
jgi:hypothetical protein